MTYARVYQHGMKAFIDGHPLGDNPYLLACAEAHEGWANGWLDASHSRWRTHALEIAGRPQIKPSMRATNLSAQEA